MITGAHSDHRPQDIRFPRTQSRDMALRTWEDKLPPLQGYLAGFASAAGIVAAVGCLFIVMLVGLP